MPEKGNTPRKVHFSLFSVQSNLMMEIITENPKFFTASIFGMKHLLKSDSYKKIILESLQFLVESNRIYLYSFCIMSNHIHLIWQVRPPHVYQNVQRDFMKFTAQKMRFKLIETLPEILSQFEVNAKDRKHQFWKRNALSIELYTKSVFLQKLKYIHLNPVKAGLCRIPEDYRWSSAAFYESEDSQFPFLTHYKD